MQSAKADACVGQFGASFDGLLQSDRNPCCCCMLFAAGQAATAFFHASSQLPPVLPLPLLDEHAAADAAINRRSKAAMDRIDVSSPRESP